MKLRPFPISFSLFLNFFSLLGGTTFPNDTYPGEQALFEHIVLTGNASNDVVQSVFQDSRGFMWFGTRDGLKKYDGYKSTVYRHHPQEPGSLASNWVSALAEGLDGAFWVGTRGGGLNRFDRDTPRFERFAYDPANPQSLRNNHITCLLTDRSGLLWIGTESGLSRWDPEHPNGFRHYLHDPKEADSLTNNRIRSLYEDRAGILWVGTEEGLNRFDRGSGSFERFVHIDGDANSLSHNLVTCIREDGDGLLWVGTDKGLNRFDRERQRLSPIAADTPGAALLRGARIWSILEDRSGALWIGTLGDGLLKLDRESLRFQRFVPEPGNGESINDNRVTALYEDRTGVLWIGTWGGGPNKLDPGKQRFGYHKPEPNRLLKAERNKVHALLEDSGSSLWIGTQAGLFRIERTSDRRLHFQADPKDANSLSHMQVRALCQTRDGVLWIGTASGLNRFEPGTEQIRQQRVQDDQIDLSNEPINVLYEDSSARLWVGTEREGLLQLDRGNDGPARLKPFALSREQAGLDEILSVCEDASQNLWVGTWNGLIKVGPMLRHTAVYRHDEGKTDSLSHNQISALFAEPGGDIWVGTPGGLNLMNPASERFQRFSMEDGLPNSHVLGILGHRDGVLWVSTLFGLSKFDTKTRIFKNYTARDGLQGNVFYAGATFQNQRGEMFFGGRNGFNIIRPGQVRDDPAAPLVSLTDFLIFNKSVVPGGDSPLTKPISETPDLTLSYKDNMISFEFAALHYADPERNNYAYRLEGLEEEWVFSDAGKRFTTYTKLDPGSYVFRVKGANPDGVWSERETSVALRIMPPPWKTWWAYALYVILAAAVVFGYIAVNRKKLADERALVRRLREIDKLKDGFLANTSHELRTPLHGIIGLAESLTDVEHGLSDNVQRDLSMIVSSAKRLSRLINDILDYSKLKNRNLKLVRKAVDVHPLVDEVLTSCLPLVQAPGVTLSNRVPADLPRVDADRNRLRQIFYNLVGNAIKFTEAGSIEVKAARKDDRLEFSVSDTGIGIPSDKIDMIFQSFEQVDASTARQFAGTGLGLAVTKQMVSLHGGEIWVVSQPGEGSVFTFSMPVFEGESVLFEDSATAELLPEPERPEPSWQGKAVVPAAPSVEGRFKILVVDDEPVNRQVLFNSLSANQYAVELTSNGPEALQALEAGLDCDLILLDIMMPGMTGYEVCRKIRTHYSAQDLPIIFMTAKDRVDDLVQGFASGGNDYLIKPTEKSELLARVKTHLELLDLHRDLERKVVDRTREISEKNEILSRKYFELESLDSIVKTINREFDFEKVVKVLLQMGQHFFADAQRASFFILDPDTKRFGLVDVIGYDLEEMKPITFTAEEICSRYQHPGDLAEKHIYVCADFKKRFDSESPGSFPAPESFIAMNITLNDQLAGFILLENRDDAFAFRDLDVATLARFREHAVTAVTKAKIVKDIVEMQTEMVNAAHAEGMAEIAINVMHQIGNALNSVKTSVYQLQDKAEHKQWFTVLGKIVALFEEQGDAIGRYLARDGRDKQLHQALVRILNNIQKEQNVFLDECNQLAKHVTFIGAVLAEQQKLAAFKRAPEPVDINQMLQETLEEKAYIFHSKHDQAILETNALPIVNLSKSKFKRVLTFIYKNAWEALEEKNDEQGGYIHIKTEAANNLIILKISDNGIGISRKSLPRVFENGFSTKEKHLGFGLHYCANTMKEMSGTIELESLGIGMGTTVSLFLPAGGAKDDPEMIN